jgi:chromate reductase
MTHLLVIDGSLRPGTGNTARALALAVSAFSEATTSDCLELARYEGDLAAVAERLRRADALLVGTGTYWGSWGSPLQRFFELMTPFEATDAFIGKPAAAIVTMDSTGGSEVAARLVATLACFGCRIPSFGWMALSRVGVALSAVAPASTRDVWAPPDLAVLARNLETAAREHPAATPWDIERAPAPAGEWQSAGPLPPAAPDFLER